MESLPVGAKPKQIWAVCVEIASLAPGSADKLDIVRRSVEWLKGHVIRH